MSVLSLLASIGGAIIFEGIFFLARIGESMDSGATLNDIPVLMGDLAITVGLYQVGLILLDLTYGFMDPRIKVGGKA